MTYHAQSQLELIATFTSPPVRWSPPSAVTEPPRQTCYSVFEPVDQPAEPLSEFETRSRGSRVAPNGSVFKQRAPLARAANCFAQGNTYLPHEQLSPE